MLKTRIALAGFLVMAGLTRADDWPSWRGPSGNGRSAEKKAPTVWAPDRNVKWRAPLPHPGNGSPIVSNGRVFVTCPEDREGKRRSLYCFDRKDGKTLWVRTVDFKKPIDPKEAYMHGANFFSASTPATDGKRVVAWHDSAGLYCYDQDGKELWSRDLGEFYHFWGHGSSPVLRDGKVLLNCGPGTAVFMTALDLETGKTLWKTDEPQEIHPERLAKGFGDKNLQGKPAGSWSTPIVVGDQVICAQPTRVVGYDLATGAIVWWVNGLRFGKGDLSYSSPLQAGDLCLVLGGYNGPRIGLRPGGAGDMTATGRLWRKDDPGNLQSIGSGVFIDGYAYVPFDLPGTVECIDPKTGETLWRERWSGAGFWGSIVEAGGVCYVTDQAGKTCVFKPGPKGFELVAANDLREKTNATPAISDGELFLRTQKSLFCIAE